MPWWLGLTGLWLLTLSTPSVPELTAAAVAALPCALGARAARRAMEGRWRPRVVWLRWPAEIPRAAVPEFVRALVTVWRRPHAGRFDRTVLPDEPEPVHEARLAAAAVAIGCKPAALVVATPPADRRMIVHRLLPGASPLLDQVSR